MVTGVETTGLALAIFPILVQSIGFYLEGSRTIKDWWNYKGVLSRLVRQLEMGQVREYMWHLHRRIGYVGAGNDPSGRNWLGRHQLPGGFETAPAAKRSESVRGYCDSFALTASEAEHRYWGHG
ncbi:hypothetical protein BDD12DRAFT_222071 [Trichophaea hybrida]|nr:hypothetical protein BDD12DRAFT_222071 [Trichophaea hybrida]